METNLEDKQIAKYELLIEVILDHQYSSGIAKKPSRIIITNKTQLLEPLLLLNCYVNVDPNRSLPFHLVSFEGKPFAFPPA